MAIFKRKFSVSLALASLLLSYYGTVKADEEAKGDQFNPVWESDSADSLSDLSDQFNKGVDGSVFYDKARIASPARKPRIKHSIQISKDLQLVGQLKDVLSSGYKADGSPAASPFVFRDKAGNKYFAQDAGLEGFFFTKQELEYRCGSDQFLSQMDDFFRYLDYLVSGQSYAASFKAQLDKLGQQTNLTPAQKNDQLNALLKSFVNDSRQQLEKVDKSLWVHKAKIYQIFPRAYNIAGRRGQQDMRDGSEEFFRDFQSTDFDKIKNMGFDTVYTMGICPIGLRNRSGSGGGSPFSIMDPETINPDLGAEQDFKRFVDNAHKTGMRVIIDFVVNHGSMDSKLIDENPAYFINVSGNYPQPADYYFDYKWQNSKPFWISHGGYNPGDGLYTWCDTAQIDYSNPATQDRMSKVVQSWVKKFDVDGFRVDMAYVVINSVFGPTWHRSMPKTEFYTKLLSEVRSIKPSTAFIAEAYANQDDLSALGFDMVYNKNENRPEGQTGWYNAIQDGNTQEEQNAINRASFLAWQEGGAGGVNFVGNHDEPAPEKVFGPKLPAAALMTLLTPSATMMYDGAEIGTDESIPTEQKTLPFNIPSQIDWNGGNPQTREMYRTLFPLAEKVRADLGDYDMMPYWNNSNQGWVGYVMISKTYPGKQTVVIGNLTNNQTGVDIDGLNLHCSLAPGEYRIVDEQQKH